MDMYMQNIYTQKYIDMNWICLRTQQMKGAVALILTFAAAFSCMV